MKFGKLELDPAVSPAVLDTETWSPHDAWRELERAGFAWCDSPDAVATTSQQAKPALQVWPSATGTYLGNRWHLVGLADGQSVFCSVGPSEGWDLLPNAAIGQQTISPNCSLTAYPTDAANVDFYSRMIAPANGPSALGATPRLGIGTRMTTQVWPGIFDAMHSRGMAANSIQNSIRELSLLDDFVAGRPPEKNYSTGIGTIEVGWTGSTYEGLWVAGTLAALRCPYSLSYGADADHIQVKRGPLGIERAKRVIQAARYYSFFTLDMADVLDYAALGIESPAACRDLLDKAIPDVRLRQSVVEWHSQPVRVGGRAYQLTPAEVGRFVGKYWETLNLVGELADHIATLKQGVAFDLELTIDEHPPEVAAFDCLTSNEEILFLTREIRRRQLPITHLAPNFGQEKGCDYRAPDGLAALEQRVRQQFELADEFGLMLDVHSGDDLKSATRQVFGRAMRGQLHFKVSPMLQLIYAQLLAEFHPTLFLKWWQDAYDYAALEAAGGSPIAQASLSELADRTTAPPSPRDKVFHYYSFPYVGRRDARGQFLNRSEFYQLSPDFYSAYATEVSRWLCEVADDVFGQ